MNWEQMILAIRSIGSRVDGPHMIEPGKWICRIPDVCGDGMLTSGFGSGETPQQATEDAWNQIENLPDDRYFVVENHGKPRRHVRWNGFMFIDLATPGDDE